MTWTELIAATAAVAAGSVVQAFSGVGAGFLVVPMLAWIDISLVPGPLIFGSLALSGIMAFRERAAIDNRYLAAILLGLLPGCIAGAWLLSIMPGSRAGIVFGAVLLIAIAITAAGIRVPLSRAAAFGCGAVSGAMGASTGVGAPMIAVLYQNESGPRVRATLALVYTIASTVIVAALTAFGRFGWREAAAGAMLVPGFLIGYVLARRFAGAAENRYTRPAVLAVSGVAAIMLLIRSISDAT